MQNSSDFHRILINSSVENNMSISFYSEEVFSDSQILDKS